MIALLVSFSSPVHADELDERITALRQQSAAQQDQAATLHARADNYRAKVAELNNQIALLQTQINISQLKLQKISEQIEDAKKKIAKEKEVLGDIVKTMYFDSSVTPLEMLASSSNISDFLDNEQYNESIKSKIQSAMTEIQTLKKSLEQQQDQVTHILSDQQNQKQQLATAQAEVNQLLAMAQQDASAADQQVKNSNAEISRLRAQQAAILAARFGSGLTNGGTCGGGYPAKWCNAPQDAFIDPWGMFTRECVSYAAFRIASSGRYMPNWGGRGNANQWDENARGAGIAVDGNPRAGDIAQTNAGPYGHVMHVDAVLPGGKIRISQYNYGNTGEYSEMTISSAGLNFIHF